MKEIEDNYENWNRIYDNMGYLVKKAINNIKDNPTGETMFGWEIELKNTKICVIVSEDESLNSIIPYRHDEKIRERVKELEKEGDMND